MMQLVAVQENVLINPEQISVIKYEAINGQKTLVITAAGEQFIVTRKFSDVYAELIACGVRANDHFFAG